MMLRLVILYLMPFTLSLFAMELKKLLVNGKINRVKQIFLLSIILKVTNNRNEF